MQTLVVKISNPDTRRQLPGINALSQPLNQRVPHGDDGGEELTGLLGAPPAQMSLALEDI